MGRPLADINEDEVGKLALQGAKNAEIAAYFGVDKQTIANRFSTILTKKRSVLRMNLRKAQIDKGFLGDTTMLIWLGKVLLGQTEKIEQHSSGVIEREIRYVNDWRNHQEKEEPPAQSQET